MKFTLFVLTSQGCNSGSIGMEILLVDNYDSFTFNLVHMLRELCGSAPGTCMW